MNKKLFASSIISTAAAVSVGGYISYGNNSIKVDKYLYRNTKIPNEFDGFKIVHISDLHNKSFGKNNSRLLKQISKLKPDIIVISGDLIDKRRTDLSDICIAKKLIIDLLSIANVYYVTGNHEVSSPVRSDFLSFIRSTPVHLCDNSSFTLKRGNSNINISGIKDPTSLGLFRFSDYIEQYSDILNSIRNKSHSEFNILLSHRPELIEYYEKEKFDLVFSGHAHGGQVRLPKIGGLYAPSQGILPVYTEGMHQLNHTTLVVSRGLGNSSIPLRIFNRPNLILVTLLNKF